MPKMMYSSQKFLYGIQKKYRVCCERYSFRQNLELVASRPKNTAAPSSLESPGKNRGSSLIQISFPTSP